MFNANNSSMKSTCNTYGPYNCCTAFIQIIQEYFLLYRKGTSRTTQPEKTGSYPKLLTNLLTYLLTTITSVFSKNTHTPDT